MNNPHVDVLIIGAGLSGIGAACHIKQNCKGKSIKILERRKAIGGTWDLFRYPGIRSDSDMFTLGYSFKPWKGEKVLANGQEIREYVTEAAKEHNVTKDIQFGLKATAANWDSEANQWTVEGVIEETGEKQVFTSNFLLGFKFSVNGERYYSCANFEK